MTIRRNVERLLALDDGDLATLYSEWSEKTWAAGWYPDGEVLFAKELLEGTWAPRQEELLERYEREGVAVIRKALEAWLKENAHERP